MKIRPRFILPEDAEATFHKAVRLEWISLVLMFLICVAVYFTLGQSEAMKAVFVEDVLALIPPIAFLVSARYRWREPNETFPYGFHHAVTIGFFVSAVAVLGLGLMILFDAGRTLITGHHPTLGAISMFGHQVWLGWLALPVLGISSIIEYTVGRLKLPLAVELHDKALAADARMNRADWMTGAGAMIGMLGIAWGWWWLDSVVALLISIEIVRDGWENLHEVITDIMDEPPTPAAEGDIEEWDRRLLERVRKLEWVAAADVRLREEGNVITGEVFVVPRDAADLTRRYEQLQTAAREVDWRYYDLALVPVERI
jgi:cation diffusion facilitator family transporter